MLLLGEQLITDEVAAVSELVKNAYDADAPRVNVTLSNVSEPDAGYIVIKDNGHGMSQETVISSWLELGTLSKARSADLKPRFSESGKRLCLGEKGLGRLAVHKLGNVTELVTKRAKTNYETRIVVDWTAFEKNEAFLSDVPIEWETMNPSIFTESPWLNGTQIKITKLRRQWTRDMIERLQRNVMALKSPFADLSDFEITMEVKDNLARDLSTPDIVNLVKNATYALVGNVDETGKIHYTYTFTRSDLGELNRKKDIDKDIRNPEDFAGDRKPVCGPFTIRLYCWDLAPQDLRAVFADTSTYTEMIRPNTGIKVFRDGFRVLPYGNPDNDWLNMDLGRVRQFERRVSRNQMIGAIEISSETAPRLLDKTDREGLIDNEAFRDFRSLVKSALTEFEGYRYDDRRKLKEATGRIRDAESERTKYSQRLIALSNMVMKQTSIDTATKLEIRRVLSETRESLDSLLSEKEQPLLVAASIGLTYMMPTHEVRRDIHEAMKLLRRTKDSTESTQETISAAVSLLKQADSVVGGIGKLMQRTAQDEEFVLKKPVEDAIELMRNRLDRNDIKWSIDPRNQTRVKGSDRLITILLLNFLDNSIYWLQRNKPEERNIKIITDSYQEKPAIVVSDSGPGFGDDDISVLTLPFFTRKPNGMGLGLYIADRIAKMNEGKLKILGQSELPGLLAGANIAVILQQAGK